MTEYNDYNLLIDLPISLSNLHSETKTHENIKWARGFVQVTSEVIRKCQLSECFHTLVCLFL